jgi:hypothetical protein
VPLLIFAVADPVFPPLQETFVGVMLKAGAGFIVITKLIGDPKQLAEGVPPVLTGVMVMVEVIAVVPLLVAVKVRLPGEPVIVPLAPRPIAVLLLVQLNELVFVPVNGMLTLEPLQKGWSPGLFIEGMALTLNVAALLKLAEHPPLEYFALNL